MTGKELVKQGYRCIRAGYASYKTADSVRRKLSKEIHSYDYEVGTQGEGSYGVYCRLNLFGVCKGHT